jgi:glycerophosphoryl diester phosphodiesterase
MNKPKIFAHRGFSSKYPENTMPAFEAAVDIGADGIEIDVQFTADKQIVITHDEMLDRTTGTKGFVYNSTYDDLKMLDFSKPLEGFAPTRIPLLSELLELLKDRDTLLNIELKNSVLEYEGLEKAVIDMAKEYNMLDRLILSSFNHNSMVKAKEICSEVQTALLYACVLKDATEYAQSCKADALHPLFYTVKEDLVLQCILGNVKLRPWTVDQPEYIEKMIQSNVDSIITNYPDVALSMIK